jgi:Domain of unknown function (DUF4333)
MTRSRRRCASYVLASLFGCAVLGGCGDQPGLDTAAVEAYLLESQASTFGDLEVGPARCPGEPELRDGMSLDCSVTVSDADVPFRVRLSDVHKSKVKVDVALDAVVLLATEIQRRVRSTLPDDFGSATVECGHDVIVTEVGDKVECTLAYGAQTRPLVLTVEDAAGRVSIA